MRPHRPFVLVLLAMLLASLAAPSHATAGSSARIHVVDPRAPGRDSIRVLGEGSQVRFTTDGTKLVGAEAFEPGAPERYIVTLDEPSVAGSFAERVRERDALTATFAAALERAEPHRFGSRGADGVRVARTFDRLIAGCVVEAPANWRDRLRSLPGVRSVARDTRVTTQQVPGLAQVRADLVQQQLGGSGQGVRVGIIDTGIEYTHPALGGAFGPGQRVAGGWDFVNGDPDPMDDNGHGTHVAGIVGGDGGGVHGLAPAVTFIAYKVLDQNGSGNMSNVIAALERSADPDQDPSTADQLDVVNLSLGGYPVDDQDPATDAVNALDSLGVTVVAAAGNSGSSFSILSPGTAPRAITVGSVSSVDTISYFSSRGPTLGLRVKPDVVAPGEHIVSAYKGGSLASLSGTSMATPHVTGAVALLRQLHPDWTHAELRSAIVGGAHAIVAPVLEQGAGRLDAYAAATATFSVFPTSFSLGRVSPAIPEWTRAETLHVTSRSTSTQTFTMRLESHPLPAGVQLSVAPGSLSLPPGGDGIVVVTVHLGVGRVAPREPPFDIEGVLIAESGSDQRRVPFTVHECLRLHLIASWREAFGVVIGEGRAWPSVGAFGSSWYLPVGTYDALTFGDEAPDEPLLGRVGIAVTADTVVDLAAPRATSAVAWELRNERGAAVQPGHFGIMLLHTSGAGVGRLALRSAGTLRLPPMDGRYRLEWSAQDPAGDVRYDIPGSLPGPVAAQVVRNDPSALRRLVEHVAVATPDSLLIMEFRLISSGEGYFGFAGLDPFQAPYDRSFDIVRWTAATPFPRHHRFGHWLWSVNPAKARAFDPTMYNGLGPLWEQDRGDTLYVLPPWVLAAPRAAFTGRDLPFGSGPGSFSGVIQMSPTDLQVYTRDFYTSRLFRDAAGSVSAGPAVEYEFTYGGQVLETGTVPDEDRIFQVGVWNRSAPRSGAWSMTLRSRGWNVAGRPSVTTVRAQLDEASPGPGQWLGPTGFAIVAGGGPKEEIVFGQDRDPHVAMELLDLPWLAPVSIEYRRSGATGWAPLVLERQGTRIRARLVPIEGEVSLRVRIAASFGPSPLEMDISPAFVGRPSPAATAALLEASADGSGAHLEWRVNAPGARLIVERRQPVGDWLEHGEVVVGDDGIARYDDAAVTAGARYGYRLAGSTVEVFLSIPTAAAVLSLAIAPNPTPRDVLVTLTLDRISNVTLALHDLQGRVVVSRRIMAASTGQHLWNLTAGRQLEAGLYFVRIERDGQRLTRRVTLIP